jgi:hypothetical protein
MMPCNLYQLLVDRTLRESSPDIWEKRNRRAAARHSSQFAVTVLDFVSDERDVRYRRQVCGTVLAVCTVLTPSSLNVFAWSPA